MKPLYRRLAVVVATVATLAAAASPAHAGPATDSLDLDFSSPELVSPGVQYRSFTGDTEAGPITGHLLRVDLWHPLVDVGLLYPGEVAATRTVSTMADQAGAVAAVNGDFFNIGQTGAPVGPAIADGEALKGAVPDRQRHGPDMPPGYGNEDGLGITTDGRAVLTDLRVDGKVITEEGGFALDALNQYAITVGGVGVFDSNWGSATRLRATCGTDDNRNAPCSDRTLEVTVTDGVVTDVTETPGSGPIPEDTVVLVARDAGVDELAGLAEGDPVTVEYGLAEEHGHRLDTALGGFPIVADGRVLTGVDEVAMAPRTSVGAGWGGRVLYLVAIDGRGASVGASLATTADIMLAVGARIAVNMDGGGSTTLVAREWGEDEVSVRNTVSGGSERSVPNGLGIFGPAW
ncbi:uncharacterized protein DUF2233 [Stackebrandtia albiflava]|uniref:Uncharacterized protein DUF2233 n=1 Tax=Stackebrandtia albiflava TaxID=406432 RepID=A0A562V9K9_9ACTN|nr:phosphodiester glycosidase family protein [Stackebrandtia albiflava]TWJ14569.1 uncharacterized protein DUF2233 [Stackebrandtia albiflava]